MPGSNSVNSSRKFLLDEISNSLYYTATTEYVNDMWGKVKCVMRKANVESDRIIFATHVDLNKYRSNFISTCKYNVLSFFPKFLFEQIMKISNVIFLCISVFQFIPDVSPSGKYSTMAPLTFMLVLSGIKELIEDLKRRISDQKTNNSVTRVFRNKVWEELMWHQVRVGDIIRVLADETFPADIVILCTSDQNSLCYVETCSLDGETNQKIRQSLFETQNLNSFEILKKTEIRIDCEPPNNRIYEFCGSLTLEYNSESLGTYILSNEQIALRGSQLRNTLSVMGIVLYTGQETKIMLNSSSSPIKRSCIDKKLNYIISILLVFLIVFSAVCSIYYEFVVIPYLDQYAWYLKIPKDTKCPFVFSFLTFFILCNNILPISLNVMIEFMKMVLAYFINNDKFLYHEESDTPALAKTSSVIEDLGQVNYIFTDKTGTLTCNMMDLKQFSVNGIIYGQKSCFVNEVAANMDSDQRPHLDEFLISLALCNTIITQKVEEKYNFKSSSPDEIALAEGICKCGYIIGNRSTNELTVQVNNNNIIFEILDVLEFTSDRKRMSVVVRCDNKIKVICKGADTVILTRLDPNIKNLSSTTVDSDLTTFAISGFRTLCIAVCDLSETEYTNWKKEYDVARVKKMNREYEIAQCCELIETKMRLIGSTAIEDKLQDGVPACIKKLREAGICFFMLTGDRLETAINIAHSTEMIIPEVDVRIIQASTLQGCKENIESLIKDFDIVSTPFEVLGQEDSKKSIQMRTRPAEFKNLCLVIDGTSLDYATTSLCKEILIDLLINCQAVICCRVSPAQKREIVDLFRNYVKNTITLAIGDGANDCPMIQAANIGIGITGREGMQAANSSDFAVAQFSYLTRLILFHGHNNFRRIASSIFYSFYKNSVINTILICYNFFNHFSGQLVFDQIAYTLFNVSFASFLPFCFGLFSQVAQADVLLHVPHLIKTIQNEKCFNMKVFIKWLLSGMFHGMIIYFSVHFSCLKCVIGFSPIPITMVFFGHTLYWCLLLVITAKASIEIYHWVLPSFFCLFIGLTCWIIFFSVTSMKWWFQIFHLGGLSVDYWAYNSVVFWLNILATPLFALLPDMLAHTVKNTWLKSPDIIVNEFLRQQKLDLSKTLDVEQVNVRLAREKQLVNKRKQKYLGFAYSFSDDRVFKNFPKFFKNSSSII